MKKLIVMVLALVLCLSLAACGSDTKEPVKNDLLDSLISNTQTTAPTTTEAEIDLAEQIIGQWVFDMSMDASQVGLEGVEGKFDLKAIFAFDNKGEYTMKLEEESYIQTVREVMEVMLLEALQAEDMTREEADAAIKEATGMTLDQLIDASMEEADLTSIVDEAINTGTYKVEGTKLITDGVDTMNIEIDGDTMKFLDTTENVDLEEMGLSFPITLTRVK